jgi:hypothetical protein
LRRYSSAEGKGGSGVGDVLVASRVLQNRAFDGDTVAVRVLPRHRWIAARSQSLIAPEVGAYTRSDSSST